MMLRRSGALTGSLLDGSSRGATIGRAVLVGLHLFVEGSPLVLKTLDSTAFHADLAPVDCLALGLQLSDDSEEEFILL